VAATKRLVDELPLGIAIGKALARRPNAGVNEANYNVFSSTGVRSGPGWTAELLPDAARRNESIRFQRRVERSD
jgi:hypothetical protein